MISLCRNRFYFAGVVYLEMASGVIQPKCLCHKGKHDSQYVLNRASFADTAKADGLQIP